MRRACDIILAGLLLMAGSLIAAVSGRASRQAARVVRVQGRFGVEVRYSVLRRWPRRGCLRWLNYLPVLWRVLDGNFSMVGARPVRYGADRPASADFGARPGLMSPYLLRRRGVFSGADRAGADRDFLRRLSFKSYVGVVLRFLIVAVLPARPKRASDRVSLLGVEIANETLDGAVARIIGMAKGTHPRQVAFVNADCFNIAAGDADYRRDLGRSSLVLADGIGVRLALDWFVGTPLRDNVNGTDLFPRLCAEAADKGLPIYLLGGKPGVATAVAESAVKRVPGLRIAGARDGYFNAEESDAVAAAIRASGARIVLVAMGAPRQEAWIARHLADLGAGVALGVGGLFDFYSGRVARAPAWMREIGLEWVYRMLQEPGRMWRRYVIGNPLFLWRAWRGAYKDAALRECGRQT